MDDEDRPRPRRDQESAGGLSEIWAAIGRIRADAVELEARVNATNRAMGALEDRCEKLVADARSEHRSARAVKREIEKRVERDQVVELPANGA